MISSLSFGVVLGAAAASLTAALSLPSVGSTDLVARQVGGGAQDSRSCLSIRDICDPSVMSASNATNAFNTQPACIALVVCETPKFFIPDFPANQPRLSRGAFNVISGGSDVVTQQQFIDFYYGTIASINATLATRNSSNSSTSPATPEFPSSAEAVIQWWQNVVAWTGFCQTSTIPYNNFADWIEFSNNVGVCGAVQSCDAATNAALPTCVPQRSTDNGSCGEVANECTIGAAPPTNVFNDKFCVLAAFCFSQSTVDVLILELTRADFLFSNKPVLSVNQPRLSQTVFNSLSGGKTVVSQQNIIDAYYGALTNTVRSCGGPPGAETSCSTGGSGPYPTDVSYVIDFWETVSAWTGFCGTREIPYQNLADYLQFSSTVAGATSC